MDENIETLVGVSPANPGEPPDQPPEQGLESSAAEQDAVRELVRPARASGAALTGPDGLLKQLTKMDVEAAEGRGDDRTPGL
ncbi:hypothetical protein GGQ69_001275 [Micrococcus sp. TA1]|nr:hypothetical protein [Micrococcus sp. TA1]